MPVAEPFITILTAGATLRLHAGGLPVLKLLAKHVLKHHTICKWQIARKSIPTTSNRFLSAGSNRALAGTYSRHDLVLSQVREQWDAAQARKAVLLNALRKLLLYEVVLMDLLTPHSKRAGRDGCKCWQMNLTD